MQPYLRSLQTCVSQARARYGGESLQVAVAAIEAGVLLREHAAGDCCGGSSGSSGGSSSGSGAAGVVGAVGAAGATAVARVAAAAAARAEAEILLRAALATQWARRAAIQARGFTLETATRDRTARGDEHTELGLAALSDLLLEGGEWSEVRRTLLLLLVPVPVDDWPCTWCVANHSCACACMCVCISTCACACARHVQVCELLRALVGLQTARGAEATERLWSLSMLVEAARGTNEVLAWWAARRLAAVERQQRSEAAAGGGVAVGMDAEEEEEEEAAGTEEAEVQAEMEAEAEAVKVMEAADAADAAVAGALSGCLAQTVGKEAKERTR